MDKKSKIILVLLVITLLSLSSYASLSRFSKGINKEGSIQTTELSYCGLNEIETLSECLIRNDSEQELDLALNTIDSRTNRLDLSKIEPTNIFEPTTTYLNIKDKTSTGSYLSVTELTSFTYVIESKLINPFSVDDNEIENISFNIETGYYTYINGFVLICGASAELNAFVALVTLFLISPANASVSFLLTCLFSSSSNFTNFA